MSLIFQNYLNGTDILIPSNNIQYIQKLNEPGVVIFKTGYIPNSTCNFSIQTGKYGLYLLNNSNVIYNGNLFLIPNKIYNFTISYKDSNWYLCSGEGYSGETNIVINWTNFFFSKVSGAPPLSARRYTMFINCIYNSLVNWENLFQDALFNETANILCSSLLPGVDCNSIYNLYPKLANDEKPDIQTFCTTFLTTYAIPSSALNISYTPPSPNQTIWNGSNPILPNWNTVNLSYFKNTYTTMPSEPYTNMNAEAKELVSLQKTEEREEIAKHFANTPPPMHMIKICCTFLANKDLTCFNFSKYLSVISIGIADAGLFSWNVKYNYWGARPFQYITGYVPIITTPNFPGYISGHSTFSGVWDQLLGMFFPSLKDISKYIADLSGISRLYGGIHFSSDNVIGLQSGRNIGKTVFNQTLVNFKNNEKFLN